MLRSRFGKHTDNDPEKPAELRHSFILHRGARCRPSAARWPSKARPWALSALSKADHSPYPPGSGNPVGRDVVRRNAAGLKRLGNGDIGMLNLIAPDRPVAESTGVCTGYGFPVLWVDMNLTLSLDDELIKKVRKIAVERDTTLTGMVRDYLEQLAADDAASGRRRREREALERSFEGFWFKVGKRTWKRADLYARS